MRVTNSMVTRGITARLLESQRLLAEAQERVATGKKAQRMSDDPTSGSAAMQVGGRLRALEQFERNVSAVGGRLDAEESALDQVTQLLTRAKELAVGQYGDTANAQTRRFTGAEVRQLFLQATAIANQKYGDDYLFGGTNQTATLPFDPAQTAVTPRFVALDPAVVPPDPPAARLPVGRLEVEIGEGQRIAGPHDGSAVFVDTGVLGALHDLAVALETDARAGIATAMTAIDAAFDDTQTLVGEVGARQNQIGLVRASLAALEESYTTRKSDLTEVDFERAVTEMMSRKTAYEAAMLASSRVMGLSLTDYLR
jgi:flagellar hook-associated protein 3 FlgL